MNLVKHRFEKNRITVDIIWCAEPGDDWLLTASKGGRIWTDAETLTFEYKQDVYIDDNNRLAIIGALEEIRRSEYEGLSSGPITEEEDDARKN